MSYQKGMNPILGNNHLQRICHEKHIHFVQTMRNKEWLGTSFSHMFLNVPHYWITTWDIWMHFVPPWTHANAASDFLSNFPCLDCIVDGVKVLCGGKTTVASSFSFVTPS
jgi:hypothetical protein